MSTAVDTAFEELVSAYDETAEPMHGVCAVCYPPALPIPDQVVTLCGLHFDGGTWAASAAGRHKCDDCRTVHRWPCGHCG